MPGDKYRDLKLEDIGKKWCLRCKCGNTLFGENPSEILGKAKYWRWNVGTNTPICPICLVAGEDDSGEDSFF